MPNKLAVDLEVNNAAKATADVTAFKNTIVDTGKAAEKTAATADAAINKIANAAQSAQQAQAAPFSPAHADIEKQLTVDHFNATKERLAASRAADAAEVASASETAGKIKAVRGFGAIFRATGLTALGINEAELNAGIALFNRFGDQVTGALTGAAAAAEAVSVAQAEAAATAETLAVAQGNAAISAEALAGAEEAAAVAASELAAAEAAAAAVSMAPIVAGFALVAAGALIVWHITTDILNAEKAKLKIIEDQAIAYGKAVSAAQKIAEAGKQALKDQADARQFQSDLKKDTDEQLQRRAETAKQLQAIGGGGDAGFAKLQKEQEEIAAELDARKEKRAKDAGEASQKRWDDYNKNAKESADLEKKLLDEKLKSINEARKKIDEIGKAADAAFAGLFAAAGSDNPFVKVFSEAEAAIDRTTEATKNLSKELQKQAADMVAAANEKNLFSARVDNAVNAANLLSDADKFRPADSRLVKRDENGNLVSAATAETVSERFARQLEAVNKIPATTDADKAIADRKIIALTQGIKPEDLTDAQRETAAKARENEAERLANAETDALKQKEAEKGVQAKISADIAKLLLIAQKDGLTGVIRIINEAEDRARESLGKRPRIGDETTRDLMTP